MPTATTSPFPSPEQRIRATRFGWWIFLSSELLFFGPLLAGYAYGRVHLPHDFVAASRMTDFTLGTTNTALLLTSSASMALAVALRRLGHGAACWLLALTAALGLAFLAIKGVEYRHEWLEGLAPGPDFRFDSRYAAGAQLFFFLYFCLTGLHALHLAAGCAACVTLAVALQRGGAGFASCERVELTGLYWHFVDVMWIFLYPLLYLNGRAG